MYGTTSPQAQISFSVPTPLFPSVKFINHDSLTTFTRIWTFGIPKQTRKDAQSC